MHRRGLFGMHTSRREGIVPVLGCIHQPPPMDKRRQGDPTLLQHIWMWQIDHICKENPMFVVREVFLCDFSSRKFFNLGNKPIMNDDEVGKSLKSCPIGRWLIDLKLFHKLGFPPSRKFLHIFFKFIKISFFLAPLSLWTGDLREMQQEGCSHEPSEWHVQRR